MKTQNNKILVIAPHADDEILGCGGTIAELTERGAEVCVAVASLVYRPEYVAPHRRSPEARAQMLQRAVKEVGAQRIQLSPFSKLELDTIPDSELVAWTDSLWTDRVWRSIFFPYPSHHQHHRRLYEACRTSMRLKTFANCFLYEYAPILNTPVQMPKAYFPLPAEAVEKKMRALEAYRDVLRADAYTGTQLLLTVRGYESGHLLAECFYPVELDARDLLCTQ